jgi:superfamily II DNA or RNA helicase
VPAECLPDLSGVKVSRGPGGLDYDERQLGDACDKVGLVGNVVDHWLSRADGRRTVVFAASVAHSIHVCERFVAAGVAAEHLDGGTAAVDRDAILARLRSGVTRVVCNCDVLSEGWDMPEVEVCILAKPTKSVTKYLQKAGRVLRPYEGKRCIILDHAGCIIEHALPQSDRDMTLEPPPKKKRGERAPRDAVSIRVCSKCFFTYDAIEGSCPECGAAPIASPVTMPEERDGTLVQVEEREDDPLEALRDRVNRLCKRADAQLRRSYGSHATELKRMFGRAVSDRDEAQLRQCVRILELRLGIRGETAFNADVV